MCLPFPPIWTVYFTSTVYETSTIKFLSSVNMYNQKFRYSNEVKVVLIQNICKPVQCVDQAPGNKRTDMYSRTFLGILIELFTRYLLCTTNTMTKVRFFLPSCFCISNSARVCVRFFYSAWQGFWKTFTGLHFVIYVLGRTATTSFVHRIVWFLHHDDFFHGHANRFIF